MKYLGKMKIGAVKLITRDKFCAIEIGLELGFNIAASIWQAQTHVLSY